MSSSQLPNNFVEDPEQFLRKTRCRQVPPQRIISDSDSFKEGGFTPAFKEARTQKMISDFLAPSAANMAIGPQVILGDTTFEIKPTLTNMVQANLFSGKPMRTQVHTCNTCVAPSPLKG
jgi:hypothetical protein